MTKKVSPLVKKSNVSNVVASLFAAASTFCMTANIAMATTFGDKIKTAFTSIQEDITSYFDIAATVCFALCLFTLLFGRSDKTAEKAYSWAFKIGTAFVIYNGLDWIKTAIKALVQ